jgi:hypothetical protein
MGLDHPAKSRTRRRRRIAPLPCPKLSQRVLSLLGKRGSADPMYHLFHSPTDDTLELA